MFTMPQSNVLIRATGESIFSQKKKKGTYLQTQPDLTNTFTLFLGIPDVCKPLTVSLWTLLTNMTTVCIRKLGDGIY